MSDQKISVILISGEKLRTMCIRSNTLISNSMVVMQSQNLILPKLQPSTNPKFTRIAIKNSIDKLIFEIEALLIPVVHTSFLAGRGSFTVSRSLIVTG